MLPAAYLLSLLGNVDYVWWSFPIAEIMSANRKRCYVVDDATYLMQLDNFARAKETGYGKFTDMAVAFQQLLQRASWTSEDTNVYFLMHPDTDEYGREKPKTIGKMLDEKLCVEGLFPIVIDARVQQGENKGIVADGVAIEGTVLLKNDGILPLQKGEKICLFGRGAGEFIFGGGGSGNVLSDVRISLADALRAAAKKGEIRLFEPLITEAEAAHDILYKGQNVGKVVLKVK